MSYKIIINELKNKIENLKSELAESKKLIEDLQEKTKEINTNSFKKDFKN